MAVYLIVMLPINGLMVFLLATSTPAWMKITSAAVVAISIFNFARGYGRRLRLTEGAVFFSGIRCRFEMPWSAVRSCGLYRPAVGTEYLFISQRAGLPAGVWDIGGDTFQVQNRPGLPEIVRAFSHAAGIEFANLPASVIEKGQA